ncbi:LysR family transcriptional regulator [Bacillus niameyensis]|uniref:LysR family transcriptional regulator n=1 Tax=Bacillus niameyensis TaxID=1522308 RepID=UPI00078571E0|nr:LysR family transcriptional regulator [Bacillus niameyensis]
MEMKWIETFLSAAQYENFRKASEELYLTQPAVSKHIKRLEESLNIQLFKREGKMVTLTAAGHRFQPIAKEIIEKYEQGITEFEAWKQGYQQKLTIAVAPQIAASFLPSLLRAFIEEFPKIEVVINVLKSYEVGGEVSLGRSDLGLTRIQPIQTNIQCENIHEEQVILVGSSSMRSDNTIDERSILQSYRLITDNHPDYWDELLPQIKYICPSVKTMAVNQVEVTKRFIEAGLGVSYLPYSMAKEELEKGKFIEIASVNIKPPASKTYLVSKVETEEVKLFSQFLRRKVTII